MGATSGQLHRETMRTITLLFGLIILSTPTFAQTITASEASNYIGKTVTVKGVVDEVHTSGKGNTFLDLGGKYPDQAFTGVIFSESTGAFPQVHALEGKTVEINGPVQLYHGKPEVILKSASQLKAK